MGQDRKKYTEKYSEDLVRRFLARPVLVDEVGCWIWTGSRTKGGYGKIRSGNRSIYAHRLSIFVHRGVDPDGFSVCHHCDNPSCINPDHLFASTTRGNSEDAHWKGRLGRNQLRGDENGNSKLRAADIPIIRSSSATLGELGKRYGVHATAIGMAKRRKTWRHIH